LKTKSLLALLLASMLAVCVGCSGAGSDDEGSDDPQVELTLYLIDSTDIRAVSILDDGTADLENIKTLYSGVEGVNALEGLAADREGGELYFTDIYIDKIRRIGLSGAGLEDIATTSTTPSRVALDLSSDKVYWSENDIPVSGLIRRADLGGGNEEDILPGRPYSALLQAVDAKGGFIYWTQSNATPEIWKSKLDGSSAAALVHNASLGGFPWSVALDADNGKIYWIEAASSKIRRASAGDGSNIEDLKTISVGISTPCLALDPEGGKMYYSIGDELYRANLDGSGAKEIIPVGYLRSVGGMTLARAD
jgi:hypothetical protein